jgi:hypothetical protein
MENPDNEDIIIQIEEILHLFLWPNNFNTFFPFPVMFYLPCADHVLLFVDDVVTSWPQSKISDWSEIKCIVILVVQNRKVCIMQLLKVAWYRVIALFTLYVLVYDTSTCIMILALPCNRGFTGTHHWWKRKKDGQIGSSSKTCFPRFKNYADCLLLYIAMSDLKNKYWFSVDHNSTEKETCVRINPVFLIELDLHLERKRPDIQDTRYFIFQNQGPWRAWYNIYN